MSQGEEVFDVVDQLEEAQKRAHQAESRMNIELLNVPPEEKTELTLSMIAISTTAFQLLSLQRYGRVGQKLPTKRPFPYIIEQLLQGLHNALDLFEPALDEAVKDKAPLYAKTD